MKRLYVLDTNVLLNDPNCIYKFEDNDIVIPIVCFEELDHFRRGNDQINENTRIIIQKIEKIIEQKLISEDIGYEIGESHGKLFISKSKPFSKEILESFAEKSPDHRILAITDYLHKTKKDREVILVSLDINLRLKAKTLGISAINYSVNDSVLIVPGMTNVKNRIFISYSHNDTYYLERIKVHLKPLLQQKLIDIWDDTKLQKGKIWKKQIEDALQSARIAILLVSADFLASDFIINNELPPLLEKSEKDGTIILPLIIKPCRFLRDGYLSKYQASNDPRNPLINLPEGEQEKELAKLAEIIESNLY